MLGNLAISVICGTVYGVTAVILGLPYPLALAVIAGILDLIPTIGATIAGVIIGIVALSVSLEALIAFAIVIVVYQQIENYVLQPTIIGRRPSVSGFTVLVSVLAFGALFGVIGAIIGVPIAAGAPDRHRGAHRRQKGSHRGRGLAQQQRPDCINHTKRVTTAHTCRAGVIGRDNNHTPGGNREPNTPQHHNSHHPPSTSLRDSVRAKPPATGGSCWPPASHGSPSRWSFFSSTRRP